MRNAERDIRLPGPVIGHWGLVIVISDFGFPLSTQRISVLWRLAASTDLKIIGPSRRRAEVRKSPGIGV